VLGDAEDDLLTLGFMVGARVPVAGGGEFGIAPVGGEVAGKGGVVGLGDEPEAVAILRQWIASL